MVAAIDVVGVVGRRPSTNMLASVLHGKPRPTASTAGGISFPSLPFPFASEGL